MNKKERKVVKCMVNNRKYVHSKALTISDLDHKPLALNFTLPGYNTYLIITGFEYHDGNKNVVNIKCI